MGKTAYKRFIDIYSEFTKEYEDYYSQYPIPVAQVEARIEQLDQAHPGATSYERKAFIYQAAAEKCVVHLFRNGSFFYEVQAGRARNGVTAGFPPEPGIGGWLMRKNSQKEKEFFDWCTPYAEKGDQSILGLFFTDFSHYPVNVDNFFSGGLKALIERAQKRLETTVASRERAFLNAAITGLRSLICIAHRFADEAEKQLKTETDADVRGRLARIAQAARHVPENAPCSFYEALAMIWYMKEMTITMEGIGQAIVCHIDRQLYPYYAKDLVDGRITREEAKDLLAEFLAITDAKWDIVDETALGGVNTAVFVGGCDRDGMPVFNDITRMVFEIYREYKLVDPKLQVRLGTQSPDELYRLVAHAAADGLNVMSIFNDDVMIPAQQRMGKPLRDSRLYVGGGCQEPVLPNCELNVRAFCYINLPKILNDTLAPEQCTYWREESVAVQDGSVCASYEAFYKAVRHNVKATFDQLVMDYGRLQSDWTEYSPCPLYSATLDNCIESAKDMTEGGARLNYSSLSPVGVGTYIDSLYAIRCAVFDKKKVSLRQLHQALVNNFEGYEELRQYMLNCVVKYGEDDTEQTAFAASVLNDIANDAQGMRDSRGGIYEPGLFSNLGYLWLKDYGATPDGRKSGEILSRGMGPSDQSGASIVSEIIHSMQALDLSRFPAGAVLYLDMPYTPDKGNAELYSAILHYFISSGGNILDINVMNPDDLRAAQLDPDSYRNLVVRVWGFSAYFVTLTRDMQDEIIHRIVKR